MPSYDPNAIREAVPIENLLELRGVRLWRGRGPCPVCGTSPRSTAFSVRGKHWMCFACGERGDVIDLLAHLDGVSVGVAIGRGAALAGLRPLRKGERPAARRKPAWQIAKEARDLAWLDYCAARRARCKAEDDFRFFARRRGLDDPVTCLAGEVLAFAYDAELLALYTYDALEEVRQ